jgi:hypothetical protein
MANALAQMTSPESWKGWKSWKKTAYQGVVKRDWVPTGRIDFATNLNGNGDADQPSEFKLLVEERRIVESIAGNENLEIQWRLATLKEAKAVVTQYHKYLAENSLIKTVFDENTILPPPKRLIERAQQLIGDGLEQITHHRAAAGLQENLDRHAGNKLQAAEPPALTRRKRDPYSVVRRGIRV